MVILTLKASKERRIPLQYSKICMQTGLYSSIIGDAMPGDPTPRGEQQRGGMA